MIEIICGENMKTICIIGAGPSGLFCAHKILKDFHEKGIEKNFQIVIIEQGKKASSRFCPGKEDGVCKNCTHCSVLAGGGGAGLFSDGKIIQDLNVGGHNNTVFSLSPQIKEDYISYITSTLLQYDGVSKYKKKPDEYVQKEYSEKFFNANLKAKYYSVLHMGSANLAHILDGFIGEMAQSDKIHIKYQTPVSHISISQNKYQIYSDDRQLCAADYVVMAVGKSGAFWLKETLSPFGVNFKETGYYFGLRVEVPQEYLKPLAELSFDPKIYRELGDGRKIKMHCFCRKGKVMMTNYSNCVVAGGHTPYTENNELFCEENFGNFNVLLSYPKAHNHETLFERFRSVTSNMLLVQTLGDFKENREPHLQNSQAYNRVKESQVANIRAVIEDELFSKELLDFLYSLDSIFPGLADNNNLLYGPAFEWCMDTVEVSKHMETQLPNVFAIGDGAGLSQGIMYSAATGIIAAECIIERMIGNET